METTCIIIEDQLPAQRILQRYIQDVNGLKLLGAYTDPVAALEFLRQQPVDLLFLDIHLPKLSGLEFIKVLPYKPRIILTTAFSDYALAGYEYDVIDYLLKPISFERFLKAVSKVLYQGIEKPVVSPSSAERGVEAASPDFIFVKSDRVHIKIDFATITHIKAEDDYTWVYTTGKSHFLPYNLKYWSEVLPADRFCRIHKSFLVQLRFIDKIVGNRVHLGPERLPIGRGFREHFMAMIGT